MKKILLTSTSFQDTPGRHQDALKATGFQIDVLRGPLKEEVLLDVIAEYDGVICGDDAYTAAVIKKGQAGRLRVISKYGIGLDKIDLEAARACGVLVTNCPGVNHTTVAEHVFAMLLAFSRNIIPENAITREGRWQRITGHELFGKRLGVFGLGRIGKEVAIRAKAFGMEVWAFDKFMDTEFVAKHGIQAVDSLAQLAEQVDVLSLHSFLDAESRGVISNKLVNDHVKKGMLLINTARGELVEEAAILHGLRSGILSGYLTDVLDEEPMRANHPYLQFENVIITPHIGSRTFESVERQGLMAVENLCQNSKS